MTIVTRFPPSPTGFMHIGNARTALLNYLYARGNDGKFLIRIEDTDRARHSEEAVQVILDALDWLGLDYDNTPESQYANRQRHIDVAHELLAAGKAYKCYCSPEELEEMREGAKTEGRAVAYDRRWRDRNESEAPEGVEPVIRIKAPIDGAMTVHDEVQGDVSVKYEQIDDFILLRSDGTPTYMLAVVVDDHDMGVTHVIRGDDHLNNTFRQNVIYDAMEWDKPSYAHCPLLLGPDGAKFSKRHGAVGVEEFRKMGYLPEALSNYMLRLGWSHGDEEIIPRSRALEVFDLSGINKAAAKFDYAKLENLNGHYMKEADPDRLIALLPDYTDLPVTDEATARIRTLLPELVDRAPTMVALAEGCQFLLQNAPFNMDEKAQKLLDDDGITTVKMLAEALEKADDFTADGLNELLRSFAKEHKDGKLGKVMMPLRAALTGTDKSPSLFHAMEVLGKEETLKRIQHASA